MCQTVSYSAVKSRKTAPVFRFCWNPFSMKVVMAATWSQVFRPFRKPAWSGLSKPSTVGEMRWTNISQRSQIKEDTVEPSVPAQEFNLKAYTAITGHNDLASLDLEPRLADHCSQAVCTAALPTAPARQAE